MKYIKKLGQHFVGKKLITHIKKIKQKYHLLYQITSTKYVSRYYTILKSTHTHKQNLTDFCFIFIISFSMIILLELDNF